MWCRLSSRISDQNIGTLLERTGELRETTDSKAVDFKGKDFFTGQKDNNFDLLWPIQYDELADKMTQAICAPPSDSLATQSLRSGCSG